MPSSEFIRSHGAAVVRIVRPDAEPPLVAADEVGVERVLRRRADGPAQYLQLQHQCVPDEHFLHPLGHDHHARVALVPAQEQVTLPHVRPTLHIASSSYLFAITEPAWQAIMESSPHRYADPLQNSR